VVCTVTKAIIAGGGIVGLTAGRALLQAGIEVLVAIGPGGGRTEPEYARLLAGAGFRPEPAISLARIESVIAATPAS
jgi:thioredoxin reductase